jgi:hypothetical protein
VWRGCAEDHVAVLTARERATAGVVNSEGLVRLVYYSLASFGKQKYERQWVQSIRSLRAHNKSVPVHLVHYNAPSDSMLREAERQQVTIHHVGDYRDRLEEALPGCARVLTHHPLLHKILSLRFLPAKSASQVLYLDCDTYFFGDVANLFSKYQKHHFYAREEPRSRRSPYGYDPSYLNEEILAEICKKEGLHFIPPYNSGVLMFNHGLHAHLVGAGKAFLWYALRLLLGISENERLARECKPALLHEVNALKGSNALAPLPYPSRNWWILDSITMLFTLGGVADLTHEALLRNDCLQNGEPYILFRPTLIHYYSNNEDSFLSM